MKRGVRNALSENFRTPLPSPAPPPPPQFPLPPSFSSFPSPFFRGVICRRSPGLYGGASRAIVQRRFWNAITRWHGVGRSGTLFEVLHQSPIKRLSASWRRIRGMQGAHTRFFPPAVGISWFRYRVFCFLFRHKHAPGGKPGLGSFLYPTLKFKTG